VSGGLPHLGFTPVNCKPSYIKAVLGFQVIPYRISLINKALRYWVQDGFSARFLALTPGHNETTQVGRRHYDTRQNVRLP
jgi:hypothetical protein